LKEETSAKGIKIAFKLSWPQPAHDKPQIGL